MNHKYALGLLLTMSTLSPVSAIRAAEPPNVLLSEIAWAGSEKSTADEWIELRNLGSGSIDVSGWSLTGVGTSGSIITIPTAASIPSGSTYLIANYANTDEKTTLVVTPNLVTTAVSIPNTGLNVTLLDSSGAIIDSLLDPGTPNFGSSSAFSTMRRDLTSLAWFTETASNNVSHTIVASNTPEAPVASSSPAATTTEAVATEIAITEAPTTPSIPDVTPETSAPDVLPIIDVPVVLDPVVTNAPATDSIAPDAVLVSDVPVELTPSIIESPPESPPVILAGDIAITSILSAPSTENDEIVVLTNTTDHPIALESLTLVDASGKITDLSGTIDAGATQQILNPNGNLNNDGDSVIVMNADVVIDEVIYGTDDIPAPKKDASLVNIDGVWTMEIASSPVLESTPDVPASESIITADIPTSSTATVSPSIEPVTPIVNTVPIPAPTVTEVIASSAISAVTTTPTEATSTAATLHVGDIIINEILPSPSTGFDEWIELKNTTNAPISLDGLVLVDASGKETSLSGTIAAQGYSTILNPSGNLNNDADSVLLMKDALVIDSVSYGTAELPAPKKDFALALVDGTWIAQQSTPATVNIETPTLTPTFSPTLYADTATLVAAEQATITANSSSSARSSGGSTARKNHVASSTKRVTTTDSIVASAARISTASTAPTVKTAAISVKKASAKRVAAIRSISVDEIANIADGARVSLDGVVIASTGILGKRSFFIDGLEIYQSTGTLVDVAVGDRVRIVGAVSVLSEHRRVNIQEGGVTHLGTSTPIVHDYAASLSYGSLLRITGTVSARDGNAVLLKTDEATFKIVPGTGVNITWADFAGATVTVTGILKHGDSETVVLRSVDDVVRISVPDSTATVAGTSTPTASASETSFLWETAALLAFASAGFGTWIWYARPKAKTQKLTLHAQNV